MFKRFSFFDYVREQSSRAPMKPKGFMTELFLEKSLLNYRPLGYEPSGKFGNHRSVLDCKNLQAPLPRYNKLTNLS